MKRSKKKSKGKKSKINGRAPAMQKDGAIKLAADAAEKANELVGGLREAKRSLADIVLQISALEQQKMDLVQKIARAEVLAREIVHKAAKDQGLDLAAPGVGDWTYKAETGSLIRVV